MDSLEEKLLSTLLVRCSCVYLAILKDLFLVVNKCSHIDLNCS